MSKLQELIQRLCPDGVEYKKLGEICKVVNAPKKLNKKDYQDIGLYPIIDQGKSMIVGYTNDRDVLLPAKEYVLFGDHTRNIKYYNGTFAQGADGLKILISKDIVLTRFLYYSMQCLTIEDRGYNRHWSVVSPLPVPVPPLEVQEEIVRILDRFDVYAAELQAELQARKEQYEYYRNLLLTFNPAGCAGEANDEQEGSVTTWGGHSYPIQWKTMGEIGKIKMCKRVMKNQTTDRGDIPFYKIGTFGKKADAFISRKIFDEYKRLYSYPRKGTILVSASGTIGRCIVYEGEEAYYQDSNIVWLDNDESIVLNTYLYHYYQIVNWNTEGGTIKRLYNDRFASTPIPIPPLELQEKIVAILDRFETLVNDLSEGLPAEIAAVKEQYEYYRNRLLTFKEKTA